MGWKFNDNFAAQEAALKKAMQHATKTVASKAEKRAQDNAPVRTGKLRDSAQVNDAYEAQLGRAQTSITFLVWYAALVHNGSMSQDEDGKTEGFRAPRPFLRDGLDASEDDLARAVTKELTALGVKQVRRY